MAEVRFKNAQLRRESQAQLERLEQSQRRVASLSRRFHAELLAQDLRNEEEQARREEVQHRREQQQQQEQLRRLPFVRSTATDSDPELPPHGPTVSELVAAVNHYPPNSSHDYGGSLPLVPLHQLNSVQVRASPAWRTHPHCTLPPQMRSSAAVVGRSLLPSGDLKSV